MPSLDLDLTCSTSNDGSRAVHTSSRYDIQTSQNKSEAVVSYFTDVFTDAVSSDRDPLLTERLYFTVTTIHIPRPSYHSEQDGEQSTRPLAPTHNLLPPHQTALPRHAVQPQPAPRQAPQTLHRINHVLRPPSTPNLLPTRLQRRRTRPHSRLLACQRRRRP